MRVLLAAIPCRWRRLRYDHTHAPFAALVQSNVGVSGNIANGCREGELTFGQNITDKVMPWPEVEKSSHTNIPYMDTTRKAWFGLTRHQ